MKKTYKLIISLAVFAGTLGLSLSWLSVSAQYNCGTYGSGTYASQEECNGTGGSSGGGLSNTGQALYVIIPAGLIVVGCACLYRLSRKKKSRSKPDNKK